jgi:hypothetical protein
MPLEVTKFRLFEKNTLRGFATVRLTGVNLEIRDITIHEKNGNRWVSLPSKPYDIAISSNFMKSQRGSDFRLRC